MDDRHSLSEPRPIPGTRLPTWEVDVYRDGVDDPVLTLTIDRTTLPPRMRKRKVVWKLPDSAEQTPNFGADEKKRILELFKLQKKSRRKLNRSSSTGTSGDERNGSGGGAMKESVKDVTNECHVKKVGVANSETRPVDAPSDSRLPAQSIPADINASFSPQADVDRQGDLIRAVDSDAPQWELGNALNADVSEPIPSHTENAEMPIGGRRASLPPPGFDMQALSLQETQRQTPPEPPRRLFSICASSSSIPVDLAKCVVDTYYPFVEIGRTAELKLHYFPGAKKSLSVGGAHAMCSSLEECLVQLQSLHGSRWEVRGVVAQPGVADSVVLLITGAVMPPTQATFMPFCHTLTLNRVEAGYQIHNDAMALLTDT